MSYCSAPCSPSKTDLLAKFNMQHGWQRCVVRMGAWLDVLAWCSTWVIVLLWPAESLPCSWHDAAAQ